MILFRATRDWREGGKPGIDLASFIRSVFFFFKAIIHFTIFNDIISEFEAYPAQNNEAEEQLQLGLVVKKSCRIAFGQNLLDGMR